MEAAAATKLVYDFTEGSREMRDLLGGKGANVAEMTRVLGAERVPAGFTITTDACVAYMKAGNEFPDGLDEQVAEALGRLEEQAEKKLGDPDDLCSGSCNPLRDCSVESARKGEGPDAQDRQRRQPSTRHTQQAATRSLLPSSLCGCGGVVAGVAVGGHGCSSPLCFNTTV